jgi:hypothetical protein
MQRELLTTHKTEGGTVVYSSVEPPDAEFADSIVRMEGHL